MLEVFVWHCKVPPPSELELFITALNKGKNMEKEKTEAEKLAELFPEKNKVQDPFSEQEPEVEDKEPEQTEEELEELKNRKYRRLEAKYQAEREAAIALNARLAAISEAQKFRQEAGVDDVDETIARIYGTNTPEAKEATTLLQQALKKGTEKAVAQALEKFEERQREREAEVAKEEKTVDSFIETIEDEYNIDLSSRTSEARKRREAFLDEMERLSPKRDGEIVEYADPIAVWEVVDSKLEKSNSRSKTLGSRSMTRSTGAASGDEEMKAQESYLKEQGII